MASMDVIIPTYNEKIENVPVVQCCLPCENVSIYICDNSTQNEIKDSNFQFVQSHPNIIYIDMGGNAGLPKAYNKALALSQGDIVCIFDDDTTPDPDFISKAENHISQKNSGIFVPLIYSGSDLLSPCFRRGPMIRRPRRYDDVFDKNIYPFNTGLTFTSDIADKVKFDETLFLEFVDHAFSRDAHEAEIPFYTMEDIHHQQNYSKNTDSAEGALFRGNIRKRDVAKFYSSTFLERVYAFLYLLYRDTRNACRYKSFKFFGKSNE